MIDTRFINSLTCMTSKDKLKVEKAFKKEVRRQAHIMITSGVLWDEDFLSINHSKTILFIVAATLKLNVKTIQGESRKREVADARKIYSYMVKNETTIKIALNDAGSLINRTHSAICNQSREAEYLLRFNKDFIEKLNQCVTAYKLSLASQPTK